MNQYAMRFAIIRFVHNAKTQEFANIGIILIHPKSGYFDFKIEDNDTRLRKFFHSFDPLIYKNVVKALGEELKRIKEDAEYSNPDNIRANFEHLTRPREGSIRVVFGGVTVAEDYKKELDQLYKYYIGYSPIKKTPQAELSDYIQTLVRNISGETIFKKSVIGEDSDFSITIPLVQKINDEITKIINPIFLAQRRSTDIYHASDKSLTSINRLRERGYISERTKILFAYEEPEQPSARQTEALSAVLEDLKKHQIEVASKQERGKIESFVLDW